jgi:glycerol-3-phosphate dehydrogenase
MFSEGVAMLPGLADQTVTATYAGLRPATEHRDYMLSVDAGARWITVAGIRSTGLSSALGLGEWAAENGARLLGEMRPAPPDGDLDWPWMPSLSESLPRVYEERRGSPIVCHCEWVTEAEVRAAVDGPVPAGTLGGLKRRTRAMMGRCQGFGCAAAVRALAPALCRGAA